ncbi:hypothetical protein [Ferroacidibacillus organovorans]|uniref:Polymerase nucleotidyl transferase domain-containing protein n=1 Tax=Ferroacidibacillus organovorans TaxID=1765683 RepID=A0A1V4ER11_9BACL|nr:hypothetical protein [Ferroacidibacillus organovorans]OPG15375.1 hypothetical protein B2M26_12195 [Ferroacidibacillus organovorans]
MLLFAVVEVISLRQSEVFIRFPDLLRLLDIFKVELNKHIPEQTASYLLGGITLGDFSPQWSDVDIVVWVNTPYVSDDIVFATP